MERTDKLVDLLEAMLVLLEEMEKRDRCRYYCRDRGNHSHLCEYSEN